MSNGPDKALLNKASQALQPDVLYANAGYDAEWVHTQAQEESIRAC
ncbi:MAG: hypothetical protein ACODAQ_01910 [Phycisphaeraceae bacterium]